MSIGYPARFPKFTLPRRHVLAMVLCGLVATAGCQKWPGTAQTRQFQMENERLLSEFRAQKKRADELQQKNDQLAQRLDESERLLARNQMGRFSSRSSSLDSRISSTDATLRSPLPSTATSGLGSITDDPKSLSRLESPSVHRSTSTSTGSGAAPQWRPMRRETP